MGVIISYHSLPSRIRDISSFFVPAQSGGMEIIMSYYWPIALIVVSNIFYNICSKSTPNTLNPFAALTVTYSIEAAVSAIAFLS